MLKSVLKTVYTKHRGYSTLSHKIPSDYVDVSTLPPSYLSLVNKGLLLVLNFLNDQEEDMLMAKCNSKLRYAFKVVNAGFMWILMNRNRVVFIYRLLTSIIF